jgi:hypothetical protein
MLTYNNDILSILLCRVDQPLLKGYFAGAFNAERSKFFAITYVNLLEIAYDDYSYYHNKLGGYTSMYVDDEKINKRVAENRYQAKSTEECVAEGVYRSFSIRIYGCLFNGEWFIRSGLCFFGKLFEDRTTDPILEQNVDRPDFWETSLFRNGSPSNISSITGKPQRHIELEEYGDIPYIVSSIMADRKEALNKAYSRYLNETIFIPFSRKMRIYFPNEFCKFQGLYSEDFELIFPESKEYLLMVTRVKNSESEYKLVYFYYDQMNKDFYQWIYPKPRISSFSYHYAEDIIDDLKGICDWDSYLFLNSSRTLDEQSFWDNYVLKLENGGYKYLKKVVFPVT